MAMKPFVAGNYSFSSATHRLLSQRNVMDDLQRQIGTGKRSETYAGLGVARVTSLEVRQKLSVAEAHQRTVQDVTQRLKFFDLSLDRLRTSATEFNSLIGPTAYTADLNGQPVAVNSAMNRLDEMIDLLNTDYAGRYLFSGRSSDVKPVINSATMLDGDVTGDGLRDLVSERLMADDTDPATGPGMGRTTVGGAGAVATLTDQNNPFGLKITGATSTLSNATFAYTAGPPSNVSTTFTGQPLPGESITMTLRMSDWNPAVTQTVTLTAQQNVTNGSNSDSFQIGSTPADTALNLRNAMTAAMQREAQGTLKATSTLETAKEFFSQRPGVEPRRIAAPVSATSTAYAAVGTRPVVQFYRGEDTPLQVPATTVAAAPPAAWVAPGPADVTSTIRSQVTARVENGVAVSIGSRANEEGFRNLFASLASVAITDFKEPVNATIEQKQIVRERFNDLASQIRPLINGTGGTQTVRAIQIELGNTSVAVEGAKERLAQRANIFESVLSDIEDINEEEVSAKILTLRTSIEASYSVTSIMSRLSLAEYLR
jgi:flagellar hook-associated protein 3 FlgL